jgi:GntR family transcriptional regulator of arabinose operon
MLVDKPRLKNLAVEEEIRRMIRRHGLKLNELIPSENRLCDLFGVSRVTVRKSLANLEAEGVLYRERGRGTFVRKIPNTEMSGLEAAGPVTSMIGMIGHGIADNYFSILAQGLEDVATVVGYQLCFSSTRGDIATEEAAVNLMKKKGFNGIVIAPTESLPPSPFLRNLCRESNRVVIVNDDLPGVDASVVASDDCEGALMAVQYLIDAGHRRIAHVKGSCRIANAADRFNGYRRALLLNGLPDDPRMVVGGVIESGREAAYAGMKVLLELPPAERPTAVFCYNDRMAFGALDAILAAGLKVPDDISLIGYGNSLDIFNNGLLLTTVNQKPYEIGKAAGEILFQKIESGEDIPHNRKILIKPELIVRESVKPISASSPGKKPHLVSV